MWHYPPEEPRHGAKINAVFGVRNIETGTWGYAEFKDKSILHKIKMWRYIDEFYMDKVLERSKDDK